MTTTIMAPASDCPAVRVAGRASAPVTGLWQRLARPAPQGAGFDPAMAADLPEPARRWLIHAIAPGAAVAWAVILEMEGNIRIGRWLPFRAVQLHAPPHGYVWAARARLGPLFICGYDRYGDGTGQMRWRLLGRAPLLSTTRRDLDRSAAGRVALDALFVPTAWLGPAVTGHPGAAENTVIAEWAVGGRTLRPQITVGPDGSIRAATMQRWAKPNGEPWGEYPCGGTTEGEADFGGIKIPTRIRAGYFFGTDRWEEGEFFRATITHARFI